MLIPNVDPLHAGVVYAAGHPVDLDGSRDRGQTWERLETPSAYAPRRFDPALAADPIQTTMASSHRFDTSDDGAAGRERRRVMAVVVYKLSYRDCNRCVGQRVPRFRRVAAGGRCAAEVTEERR